MKKVIVVFFVVVSVSLFAQNEVEQWRIFEIPLKGSFLGNPFTDVRLSAVFTNGTTCKTINGFYDGNGVFKLRFMPEQTGRWTYKTSSNIKSMSGKSGKFLCVFPGKNNHGPVCVKDTFNFAYTDGKPFYPFGTTSYAWVHQSDSLVKLTLSTLSKGYFNKMRMCVFPKDYDWNMNEPILYPFQGKPLKDWDYTRLNPKYFQNIERRIQQLDSLGIEADLILFHPYDRWGFKFMGRQADDLYLQYVIARFAAYKNVWWSVANEWDFVKEKKKDDWDHYIKILSENDPYKHLLSIHNGSILYNYADSMISHVSIQNQDTYKGLELRRKYKKPVIYDECRYEGNILWKWGNITGEEMVNKFWRGVTNGAFVTHGETYLTENIVNDPAISNETLWWSKGGVLKGKSSDRIKFLRQMVEQSPGFLEPVEITAHWLGFSCVSYKNSYYLVYFNTDQPQCEYINLPKDTKYKIEVIDTWNMTITTLPGEFSGKTLVPLPSKPLIALRIIKINQ